MKNHASRWVTWGVLCGCVCAAGGGLAPADEERAVEQAHREIWRRFISSHGTFYDYTALGGTVLVPSPEECVADRPNALGWWTPIASAWRKTSTGSCANRNREACCGWLRGSAISEPWE